jgi:cyclic pyranopterin phosphate synthase
VIHDLCVSVTDRCNYKCVYCRTGDDGALTDSSSSEGWKPGAQHPELAIDEYLRLIRVFVSLGITKVRLTGGEQLLRRGLVELVQELARLRTFNGSPLELALTTNGHLLDGLATPLEAAGLDRVTVSMDAVDAPVFERITRVPGSFEAVLRGIRAARAAGLGPLKINCVLLRGFNDDQIEGFAHFARRGQRWGTCRLHCSYNTGQGGAPSHRRTGIPEAPPFHGAHWRLRCSYGRCGRACNRPGKFFHGREIPVVELA